jgi:GNAT superfamily N-acetyltransferase
MFVFLGLKVERLGADDGPELDALLVRCADFIRLTEGREPAAGDGLLLLDERPEAAPDVEKLVLGLYDGPCLIGVMDLLKDYPAAGVWQLGLMLIEPERRRSGIGASLLGALEDWIAGQGGRSLRLGVVEQNAAGHRFWAREGFRDIGTVEQDLGPFRRTVLRMERALPI